MIPKIPLENIKLSKIVCGTNQFVGITHRANPFEMWAHLRRFKLAETVAKFMIHLSQEHGVNCCVSSPRDKIYKAIQITEKETGERFYWLCTPSRRKTAKNIQPDIYKQIDWCAERDVLACMPHRSYTDWALDKETLKIGGNKPRYPPYSEVSAYIRDRNMIPGLSSHYFETVKAVEQHNYDASLIIQPLNKKGFQSDTDPHRLAKVIQDTKIQILNIKPMAAGRLEVYVGLSYCLSNIKENDFLAIGFGKFEYCVEDGKILEHLLNSKDEN